MYNLELLDRNQRILQTRYKRKYQDYFSFIKSKKGIMTLQLNWDSDIPIHEVALQFKVVTKDTSK